MSLQMFSAPSCSLLLIVVSSPSPFLLHPFSTTQVHVVKLKGTDNVYAMKILNKFEMLSRQHVSGLRTVKLGFWAMYVGVSWALGT